jgi:nucleoprotein TPR
MELKKHTEEAASKVAAVLQRAEEQGKMIESLHTSVSIYSIFFVCFSYRWRVTN